MATVKEVKLMKDGAMVTPLTLIDSIKNLDGTKYKDTVTSALNGKAPKSTGSTSTTTYTLPSMSVGQICVFNMTNGNDLKLPSGGTYVVANEHTNCRGKTVSGGTVIGDGYNIHAGTVLRIS